MSKKNILLIIVAVLIVFIIFIVTATALVYFGLRGIPQSQIDGNVPDEEFFSGYLSRDLSIYFTKKLGTEVSAEYELLRDEPTQVGVAAPKFYAWVYIKNNTFGEIIDSGAVRVGANAKESFTVTDYLSKNEIKNDPDQLYNVFPEEVSIKILKEFIY